jgi:alpha-1,3-rhamnosyl/mannosyltransferase
MTPSDSPLSIVICAFNALEYTKLLVESIRKHSRFRHELVVYSDGSTDGTSEWLRKQDDLVWQHDRKNRGICTAMNRAAQMATRRYLFFPNTDHVLAPDWDAALLPRLRPRKVVSCQSIEPGVVPVAAIFHRMNCGTRWDEFDEAAYHSTVREVSDNREVSGINYPFVLSKALWDEVGGLDERFDPGPANDPDLFYRLHLSGAALVRAQDVVVYHFSGKSSRMADEADSERRAWHEITVRNERRFEEKWGERYRYSNGGVPDPGPEALRHWAKLRPTGSVPHIDARPAPVGDELTAGAAIGGPPKIEVNDRLRVAIDARSLSGHRDGISVYTTNLVRALARSEGRPLIHCLTRDPSRFDLGEDRPENLKMVHWTGEAGAPAGDGEELCTLLGEAPPHLLHGPAFSVPTGLGIPSVVTVHDLAFALFPQWYPEGFVRHLDRVVRESVGTASRVIAVSESTRQDLLARYPVAPERVDRVYEALPEEFHRGLAGKNSHAIKDRFTGGRDFILTVGAKQGRKGTVTLVRAFAHFRAKVKSEYRLLLVGASECEDPRLSDEIASLGLEREVMLTDRLPTSEVAALYSASRLFVYPSIYEGFGLPLLEAMASGVPIVTSSGGSLPEVAGDAARLFPPDDVDSLAQALEEVIEDRELSAELIRKGSARLSLFSWDTAARETLATYTKALSAQSRTLGAVEAGKDLGRLMTPDAPAAARTRPRIAIDARLAGVDRIGTGRYTSEILRALPLRARDAEFVVIGPESSDALVLPAGMSVVQHVHAGKETLLDPAWEQFSLPSHLLGCDLYFSPTGVVPVARPCKSVPVIHDLGFLDHPEHYEPALRAHLSRWVRNACRTSESLIAVSQFTKDRITHHYGLPPERIRVVHHGPPQRSPRPALLAPAGSTEGHVLCVSSFEPNKNLVSLVAAFSEVAKSWGGNLVLAGRRGRDLRAVEEQIRSRRLSGRVILKVDASDHEVGRLYERAVLFVYPSLYEGFGFPLLEAMEAGVPVLTSRKGACPEVLGAGGQLVEDPGPASLAAAMERLLSDEEERSRLRNAALSRAKEFSWDKAADQTWDVLRSCLEMG